LPYKRRAHVLFVGSGEACRALLAAHFANTIGAAWMEARAVLLQAALVPLAPACELAGGESPEQTVHGLNQENIAWADLIVTLDEAANLACLSCPTRVQQRCYLIPQPETTADMQHVRDTIQQRVEGMIGGMRMMS